MYIYEIFPDPIQSGVDIKTSLKTVAAQRNLGQGRVPAELWALDHSLKDDSKPNTKSPPLVFTPLHRLYITPTFDHSGVQVRRRPAEDRLPAGRNEHCRPAGCTPLLRVTVPGPTLHPRPPPLL
jgi:hypothetical protein